jgi:hypothetical protein
MHYCTYTSNLSSIPKLPLAGDAEISLLLRMFSSLLATTFAFFETIRYFSSGAKSKHFLPKLNPHSNYFE